MTSSTTLYGRVAQLVERWPEEPSVGGSNPSPSTKHFIRGSGIGKISYYW